MAERGQREGGQDRHERPHHRRQIGKLGADEARRLAALLPTSHSALPADWPSNPGPTHAAVTRPMTPTDSRESIAESIRSTTAAERARHRDLILSSISVSRSGPARQHESADAETDHQQWEQRENRVVGETGREEVALASRRTNRWRASTWSNHPNRARSRSRIPGLAGSLIDYRALERYRRRGRNPSRS